MTQTLALDLQMDVIAALSMSLLVKTSVPVTIHLADRPEGQGRPVDFGNFWCD